MSDTEGNYQHISFKENENLEYKVHVKDPVPPNFAFHLCCPPSTSISHHWVFVVEDCPP